MGKEMRTCEKEITISISPEYDTKSCNDKAEFHYKGYDYCRFHWVIESFRILVCQTCDNPTFESYQAISYDHDVTCWSWYQGVDCMCLEAIDVCHCEENARIIPEVQSAIDDYNGGR